MKTILILILSLTTVSVFGQRRFEQFKETDNLIFSYRFKKECFIKRDSPLQLVLHIRNTGKEAVEINFTLDYYWALQHKAESEKVTLCIRAGRVKRGGRADLIFSTENFTNVQLKSEDFSFEIEGLSIEQKENCR